MHTLLQIEAKSEINVAAVGLLTSQALVTIKVTQEDHHITKARLYSFQSLVESCYTRKKIPV